MGHILYLFFTTAALLKSYQAAVSDTECNMASANTACNDIPNSECDTDDSECVCSNGFKENPIDECNAVLRESCATGSEAEDCTNHVENSACTGGTCSCATNYLEENHICKLELGQTCNADVDCVSNANCDAMSGCICNSGYTSSDGLCVKAIGSECSDTEACPDDMNLVCSGANCVCADGYAERTDVCTRLLGGSCGTGTEVEDCTDHVDNSACTDGTCSCDTIYTEENNICTLAIGSECSNTKACPENMNLVCSGTNCVCAEDYAEKNDVCTLTVSGTPCTTNGEECDEIQNAECDVQSNNCNCSPGYVMNVDVCEVENSATTIGTGIVTISLVTVLSVLMALA